MQLSRLTSLLQRLPATRPLLSIRRYTTGTTSATSAIGSNDSSVAVQMRTHLDANTVADDAAAWTLFTSSTAATRRHLSAADVERLLLVASSSAALSKRALRSAAEDLFAINARAAAADVDAVFDLLRTKDSSSLEDIDAAIVLATEALARAAHFEEAETVLRAFVERKCGLPKPNPSEMDAKLAAEKMERDRLRAERIRAEEVQTCCPKPTDNSTDLPTKDRLVSKLLELCADKPTWHRHPPLPKDASPALIKKRTRPAPPPHIALLIATYNSLLKAYVSNPPTPTTKEATLRLLSLLNSYLAAGKAEIQHIQSTFNPSLGIPPSLLLAMLPEKRSLQVVFDYAHHLTLANGPPASALLETWDAWFDGIGKIPPAIRYGTGCVGYAHTGNMAAFSKFLKAFDTATIETPDDRAVVYAKSLKGLVSSGRILEAAEFFESARANGFEWTEPSYKTLITGIAQSKVEGGEVLAAGLIERLKSSGIKGKAGVLYHLKAAFGEESEAVKLYRTLI
ncbi:hypothetical protein BCR33DRAFT_711406 [Rhizoclosmatium globosum]|uniref:Pentacotripeptide-repeat region of PRORP domain-containing protein n=1 Tax=Rhizoclosmatium globosum TaxID=329046 RepID=A0A1Y2D389_9FUNG|nr:hypothetical protein BCR33DRAFT_711406 [Rhizoclosmatium globosum]|eukprot:ORY53015.1 hypothetical protein BCR33DRAFT_711406 [Rhizoclosmatium globosum]